MLVLYEERKKDFFIKKTDFFLELIPATAKNGKVNKPAGVLP
jgi:hypothetical protein